MSWTDERVARLTKLWQDGLSASQIAADLGGVTRNAVIGKVHRLGMSGRDKAPGTGGKAASSTAAKAAPRKAASGGARAQSGGSTTHARPQRTAATASVGNAALKMELEEEAVEEVEVEVAEVPDNVVPISRKLTLLQLTESTCKWPTGDPTMPGFSFCGHTSAEEKPYCEYHAKIAFQPPNERRRRR